MQSFKSYIEEASDGKIKIIAKKYNISEDLVKSLDNDLDLYNGKYLDWCVKTWVNNYDWRRYEDEENIKALLTYFHTHKDKKVWGDNPKDINLYKTTGDLARVVNSVKSKTARDERGEIQSTAGNELIASDSNNEFQVWKLTDYSATETWNLKETSEWCIAYPEQWENYGPPFFMLTDAKVPIALLHLSAKGGGISFMNQYDEPVGMDEIIKMESTGFNIADMAMELMKPSSRNKISAGYSTQTITEFLMDVWYEAQRNSHEQQHLTPKAAIWKSAEPYFEDYWTKSFIVSYWRTTQRLPEGIKNDVNTAVKKILTLIDDAYQEYHPNYDRWLSSLYRTEIGASNMEEVGWLSAVNGYEWREPWEKLLKAFPKVDDSFSNFYINYILRPWLDGAMIGEINIPEQDSSKKKKAKEKIKKDIKDYHMAVNHPMRGSFLDYMNDLL